jgi:hypothetical protein
MFSTSFVIFELNITDLTNFFSLAFMNLYVLNKIASLGILATAARLMAFKRFFFSMSSDVIEQIVPFSKNFSTTIYMTHQKF